MKTCNYKTFLTALILFIFTTICQSFEKPSAYAALSKSAFKKIDTTLLLAKNNNINLPLSHKKSASFTILRSYTHGNGDTSILGQLPDNKGQISATLGNNSIFGQMHIGKTHYILTTEGSGSFVIKLPQTGLDYNGCNFEHTNNNGKKNTAILNKNKISKANNTVIDFLVLYSQEITDRYPGNLLETRLNQYFNLSNQVFANSNVDLSIRLVATKQTTYKPFNSNFEARNDLQLSLSGVNISGLETVKSDRELYGADMVVLMRPHNIETRGNCGIAFFPTLNSEGTDFDSSYGVHIMSDGMSSWSICTDQLLVHELGHNLGAGHNNAPPNQRFIPAAAGFAKLGQFATVMGSFGTGRPERFLELNTFSNPNIQCGGVACGSAEDFNNVNVINQLKDVVANYQPTISNLPTPEFFRNTPDNDGDGVSDWDDAFPFDPTETKDSDNDGVGDNNDVFPTNSSEQLDTDGDGIGNNADSNDDGDSVDDESDYFPLDKNEINDTDKDGVGDNSDAFPTNRFEQADYDNDTIGDNQDSDDDNDGFNDINVSAQDLLVINTGSNQILRFDTQTGESVGIELLASDGLLTFQSDLTYRAGEQVLFYTSSSSVKRLDLSNRNPLGEAIPAYIKTDFQERHGIALFSGFPTSLINLEDSSDLLVTRLGDRSSTIYRGSFPTVRETSVRLFESYVDENGITIVNVQPVVDVIYNDSNLYFLGQTSQIFKGQVADFNIGLLGADDHSWMNNPYAFVKTDDDRLLISNQNSHEIGIVNANSGAFMGILTDISDHGYSNPTGMAVTRENVLLVAANDQNAILKFNYETGEFLGELVKDNGLDKPHKMILVPKLNDRFHHDAQKVIKPNAGLWYNPETNGRGFDIQVFNNRLSVIWYTFDEQGLPTWYISSGELSGFKYSGGFDKTKLNPDGSFTLENVGTISIDFSDERNAQIIWQINNSQGSENIEWLVWSYAEEIDNYTGLWGRPDGPGWGVSVATIGKTSIAIPYIYDSAGEPRWLISNPVNTSAPLNFDFNAIFSDTLCPSCSGLSAFTTSPAGTMVLDLTSNKTWNSNIQFPSPLSGEWLLNNTEIKLFSSEATRPR